MLHVNNYLSSVFFRCFFFSFVTCDVLFSLLTVYAAWFAQQSQVVKAKGKKNISWHTFSGKWRRLFVWSKLFKRKKKRQPALPWETSEVMPEEPGNHSGVSRHDRLASHLNIQGDAWAICVVLPTSSLQHTQIGGEGLGAVVLNLKWLPCVSMFFLINIQK